MRRTPRLLLIFVDGLGLGPDDPTVNPLHTEVCPRLLSFLTQHARAIDAQLGVPGLPQSATGQATLLTGINTAALLGRHVEGFPPAELKRVVKKHSIFRQLSERGLSATFANAFFVDDLQAVRERKLQSVTTVAAIDVPPGLRDKDAMLRHRAVYQDLTRETLRERGYDGPLISPECAALDLLAIAREFDFTLFEYFQTDRAGHTTNPNEAGRVLRLFDAFWGVLWDAVQNDGELLLALTSDHGNIEDITTRMHTSNPVPFAAIGPGADQLQDRVRSLVDVTPAIVEFLSERAW